MKTVSTAFMTAFVNKGTKFSISRIDYQRSYWDGADVVQEADFQSLTIEKAKFKSIGTMSWNIDTIRQNEFKSSAAVVQLLNSDYRWSPNNPAGVFGANAAGQECIAPMTVFQIYAGFELADGSHEYLMMFTGQITDYSMKPAAGIFEAIISGFECKLQGEDAQDMTTAVTLESVGPGDDVTTDFVSTSKGVGFVDAVYVNDVLVDDDEYTVNGLDTPDYHGQGAITISFVTAPLDTLSVKWTGRKWLQDKSIGYLVGALCDIGHIAAEDRSIDEPIFPGGTAGSKTIDSQADWEAGTVLDGIDTTTIPGGIQIKAKTVLAYTGATQDYVVPDGVTSIYVIVDGPGGGGGGGDGAPLLGGAGIGGGGGGGEGNTGSTSGGAKDGAGGTGGLDSYVKRSSIVLAQAAVGAGGAAMIGSGVANPGGAKGTNVSTGLTLTTNGGSNGGDGGAGGTGGGGPPGTAGHAGSSGDQVSGAIAVTPGETLTMFCGVGANGGGKGLGFGGSDGANGGAGANGTITIYAASAAYESEVFDILAAPISWGALAKTETLNGGTIDYAVAVSDDGTTFDDYVEVSDTFVPQSDLKEFFKVRATLNLGAGLTTSPVLSKLVVNFSTSGLFISLAAFRSMDCYSAVEYLAFISNSDILFDSSGKFYFKAKNSSTTPVIEFKQSDILSQIIEIKPGWVEVLNDVQVNFGSSFGASRGTSFKEYNHLSAPEARPNSYDRFRKRLSTQSTTNFLFSNDANIAAGMAQAIQTDNTVEKRRVLIECRLLLQVENGDVISISHFEDPLLENNYWGDPLMTWAPIFGVPGNVALRSFKGKILQLSHNFDTKKTRMLLLEVLS